MRFITYLPLEVTPTAPEFDQTALRLDQMVLDLDVLRHRAGEHLLALGLGGDFEVAVVLDSETAMGVFSIPRWRLQITVDLGGGA